MGIKQMQGTSSYLNMWGLRGENIRKIVFIMMMVFVNVLRSIVI